MAKGELKRLVKNNLEKRSKELYAGDCVHATDVAIVMDLLATIIKSLYGIGNDDG